MITIRHTLAAVLCLYIISASAMQTEQQSESTYMANIKSTVHKISSAAAKQFHQRFYPIISKATESLGSKKGIITVATAALAAITSITVKTSSWRQQITNSICSHTSHTLIKLSHYINSPRLLLLGLRVGLGNTPEYAIFHANVTNPNTERLKHMSPLHIAVLHSYTDIAKLILAAGANTETQTHDDGKLTPLHVAAIRKNPEMINMLLNAGANKEQRDGSGKTALLLAVLSGNPDTVETLIKAGADKFAEDNHGTGIYEHLLHTVNPLAKDKILKLLLPKKSTDSDK